ncbi:hypothetical protein CK228_24600 [Mesorhizobium sp. WSM4312]|nr:hypothetical protein CK228_24600 [Mesorhizobium sp. WSM4312]PBC20082.1 hypothetical protein CK226_25255 [Mesorhizobium sp. WSM4311]TRC75274.1 methyltransferase domain-containing protein [Mesorhizobium sp. WSM4310]TRC77919.1 methyltransferase domain-containing protein [Mesorhizobium sp. WSM4315]TRC78687.1 methyltransferase domain-containing protein [Mesorhizobium sp. WSM4307]TRC95936.1 methyltransferase domain-containing protein [Mesorhizobium sp. WSM4305]
MVRQFVDCCSSLANRSKIGMGWTGLAPTFIAKQLSWPSGIGGWLVRAGMNRGNARLNSYALDQLQLVPEDRVLEVGFGGGAALPRRLRGTSLVCGVDRSQDVVKTPCRQFAEAVSAGRAEFHFGTVEDLPLRDSTFEALSVHTVYFWQSLEAGSAELARVLVQAGASCWASSRRCIWTG